MAKKSKQVQEASAATRAANMEAGATESTTRRASRRPDEVKRRKEARKSEYDKQQRQWFWTKVGMGVIAAIVVVVLGWGAWGQYREWQVTKDVDTYFGATDFTGAHINDEPVLYEQIPPVGGYHRATWQNCGYYDKYIENEYGVHAMEHGAVWITYDPNLPQDQIDTLKSKTDQQFVLVSPYPGMDAPVIASVWGKQIKLDGANDDRLDPFISEYRKNPGNSPEPNGICWSGVSLTTDVEPQQEPFIRTEGSEPVGGIPASMATATAAALNPTQATPPSTPAESTPPAAISTPVAPPVASPAATPVASPQATPQASPEATPASE